MICVSEKKKKSKFATYTNNMNIAMVEIKDFRLVRSIRVQFVNEKWHCELLFLRTFREWAIGHGQMGISAIVDDKFAP